MRHPAGAHLVVKMANHRSLHPRRLPQAVRCVARALLAAQIPLRLATLARAARLRVVRVFVSSVAESAPVRLQHTK